MSGETNFVGMIKFGVILALFGVSACLLLAFVYLGTKGPIAQHQAANLQAALEDLFPDADDFKEIDNIQSPDPSVVLESAFAAMKNGEVFGAALTLSRASYSGPIKVMAGISTSGIVIGVKILEHSDTPGLGANAASDKYFVDKPNKITFYGQFAGKKVTDPFEVKKDIIIITASTITSHAVAASVKAAGVAAAAWFSGREADAISSASKKEEQ
ncbi:MAG: FMN-binding protein [Treponema sp.]|jgi:electron transport complex protein RnfG|nr:FMN-binding protein [Treponema sp.]